MVGYFLRVAGPGYKYYIRFLTEEISWAQRKLKPECKYIAFNRFLLEDESAPLSKKKLVIVIDG